MKIIKLKKTKECWKLLQWTVNLSRVYLVSLRLWAGIGSGSPPPWPQMDMWLENGRFEKKITAINEIRPRTVTWNAKKMVMRVIAGSWVIIIIFAPLRFSLCFLPSSLWGRASCACTCSMKLNIQSYPAKTLMLLVLGQHCLKNICDVDMPRMKVKLQLSWV